MAPSTNLRDIGGKFTKVTPLIYLCISDIINILGIITLVLHFWFFLENDNGRSNGNLIAFQSLLWPAFSFLTTSRICCMTIDPAIGWQ